MGTMDTGKSSRILSVLGVIIGGLGTILSLLIAFGVDISPDQHTAIIAVGSLLLLVVSAILHPDIPIGPTEGNPPTE